MQNLQLRLPPHVQAIGFHEGTRRGLSMHPVGTPTVNDNIPRLRRAPVSAGGAPYLLMRTRDRAAPPTSAVDLSMPFNHTVYSPVSGTVRRVRTFALYGTVPDNIIHIVPDGRPDVELVVMHVNGVRVRAGQRVSALETPLAHTARQLPFRSQIDRYAGARPHIHLELRPR